VRILRGDRTISKNAAVCPDLGSRREAPLSAKEKEMSDKKQLAGYGCLFTLGGIGALLLFPVLLSITGMPWSHVFSKEGLGFIGLGVGSILLGLFLLSRAGQSG
jgi:hypothetical protein